MGRSIFGLTSSSSGSNITIMSSNTLLFLFGVLIFVAFVAAFNEGEMEDGEISELSPAMRFVRDANPKKGKKKGKKGKGQKGKLVEKRRKVEGRMEQVKKTNQKIMAERILTKKQGKERQRQRGVPESQEDRMKRSLLLPQNAIIKQFST